MSRFATIVGVVAVGVALATAGAGVSIALAGATPQGYRVPASPALPVEIERPKALELSSLDAINQHLRSRGLDPATFVVQSGPLNYAGPNCPGAVFNCTTAARVIQIAAGAPAFSALNGPTTANEAECVPEEDSTAPLDGVGCVIVQTAAAGPEVDQQASCKVESKIAKKQVCDITQLNNSGGDNQAQISMKIDSAKGSTQLADQEAWVYQQTVRGGNNQLQADEALTLAARGPATTQDGYQSVVLTQRVFSDFVLDDLVLGSGNNQAQVTQTQNVTAYSATGGSQAQNAGTAAFGDPCNGDVEDANSCVEYDQSTDTGANQFEANQRHDLKATSADSDVTQVQGCDPDAVFEKPCGLEETGDQRIWETDDSKNRSDVVQDGSWVLEAPEGPPATLTTITGPVPCPVPRDPACVGTAQIQDPHFGGSGTEQIGGPEDAFRLSQLAKLEASADPAIAIQSHENSVDDQSTGEVTTKSTIVLNDEPPSVITCSGDGQRCTYTQRCQNFEPGSEEDPQPFCPRNGETTVPATTTSETETNGD